MVRTQTLASMPEEVRPEHRTVVIAALRHYLESEEHPALRANAEAALQRLLMEQNDRRER